MDPASSQSAEFFLYELRVVAEAAARAAARFAGRGPGEAGPAAAGAMRDALNQLSLDGTVIVSDAGREGAEFMVEADRVGDPSAAHKLDLAVDPVEGTRFLARGMTNAMSVIAVAPKNMLFQPGPALYMEKIAAPVAAFGKIDFNAPIPDRLAALADALDKPIQDLSIYVLERDRNKKLVKQIRKAGARVSLFAAGDIAGALMAALPGTGIDALMGTGGVPEGILAACAMRALGAEFLGRFDPQQPQEAKALKDTGMDKNRWYTRNEIVASHDVQFCATGITSGSLLDGVQRLDAYERTQTLLLSGLNDGYEILTAYHRREDT
ncbi:MAG: fructose-bisphosphatase class II [Alphaproteobacteria bacterium]|jgi:fructose-1,6-bisphosphatase II|nr:fructose-bisphosphatase class II [Alphaproteobacteria bacterium]MBT4710427.1 fructose-bisphosphatase class II [Alphaproteobacteria bacterium]